MFGRSFSADLLLLGILLPEFLLGQSVQSKQQQLLSSLGTYQMTSGGLGVPRPTCTLFFCDRSSISAEAWEEMKQNKRPVRDA